MNDLETRAGDATRVARSSTAVAGGDPRHFVRDATVASLRRLESNLYTSPGWGGVSSPAGHIAMGTVTGNPQADWIFGPAQGFWRDPRFPLDRGAAESNEMVDLSGRRRLPEGGYPAQANNAGGACAAGVSIYTRNTLTTNAFLDAPGQGSRPRRAPPAWMLAPRVAFPSVPGQPARAPGRNEAEDAAATASRAVSRLGLRRAQSEGLREEKGEGEDAAASRRDLGERHIRVGRGRNGAGGAPAPDHMYAGRRALLTGVR